MSKDWPLEAVNSTKDTSEGLTSSEVSKVEEAVHELLGPDQKIVGVEKKVIVREEEVRKKNSLNDWILELHILIWRKKFVSHEIAWKDLILELHIVIWREKICVPWNVNLMFQKVTDITYILTLNLVLKSQFSLKQTFECGLHILCLLF